MSTVLYMIYFGDIYLVFSIFYIDYSYLNIWLYYIKPNVTGRLHMGHAIFVALQDVLARFHR